jgi:PIN domain-containing protein
MPAAIAADARVDLHTVYWPRGTKDPVWMPIAAERHLAIISGDVSVRYHPAEKEIIKNAGVCMYILRGSLNGDQIRDALVKALPTVCRRHRQLVPPVICYISRDGEVIVKEGARRGAPKQPRG